MRAAWSVVAAGLLVPMAAHAGTNDDTSQGAMQQAPPPGAEAMPPAQPPSRRAFMLQLRGGVGIPLAGVIASQHGLGGFGSLVAGLQTSGLSIGAQLGVRYFANGSGGDGIVSIGLLLRYTLLRDLVIHPFGEINLDYATIPNSNGGPAHFNQTFADGTYARTQGDPMFVVAGAIGVEYDLTAKFSIELAARATGLIARAGDPDFILEPYLALTYYH